VGEENETKSGDEEEEGLLGRERKNTKKSRRQNGEAARCWGRRQLRLRGVQYARKKSEKTSICW